MLWRMRFASQPAAVDDEILRGAHAAVVGGKEEHHAGEIVRLDAVGQALPLLDDAVGILVDPELELALWSSPSRAARS